MPTPSDSAILQNLCNEQQLAVLATEAGLSPYASLVAVAFEDDLKRLYFATLRSTRKFANLTENRRVALLLDNRSNQVTDFSRAAAATVIGTAEELSGRQRAAALRLYLKRHPHLEEFTAAPSCALFRVGIQRIYLVTRFQNVMEFHFPP